MMPLISICIPAYQAEQHLRVTLESALAQDHPRFEVVVVDNNSSDGTSRILDGFSDERLRVVRNSVTLPVAENFNAAIAHSRGRYVKLLCADDLLAPTCVRRQSEMLEKMPTVNLVSTRTDFIDEFGRPLRRDRGLSGITGHCVAPQVIRSVVRSGTNPIGPPVAAMFRRADFDACGGFSIGRSFVLDLDLWARLLERGSFFGVPETLASFRMVSESITATASSRSQRAELACVVDKMTSDPRWGVTAGDITIGQVRVYDMQMRRRGLYAYSALRTLRHRRGSTELTSNTHAPASDSRNRV